MSHACALFAPNGRSCAPHAPWARNRPAMPCGRSPAWVRNATTGVNIIMQHRSARKNRSRLPGGDLPERRKRWTSGDSLGEAPSIIWRLPETVGAASCYRRSNQVIPGVLELRQRGGSQPRIRSCPRSPNSREMMDGTFLHSFLHFRSCRPHAMA